MFEQLYYKILAYWNNPYLYMDLIDNRFILIFLVVILMRLKYSTYQSLWVSAFVNIPGTILHELMHFLVGLITNAKPCNFTVFPRRDVNGNYVMGSVGFRNVTYYNAIPASLAPLMLLPIGFYINRYALPYIPMNLTNYILYVLLQTIIIENSIPSKADFRIASMFVSGVFMYTALFIAFLFIL